jgi:hypothetical protein
MRFSEADFRFWKAWPGNWWHDSPDHLWMHWKVWCMGGEL